MRLGESTMQQEPLINKNYGSINDLLINNQILAHMPNGLF